jgi:hypothetical protein
MAVTIAILTSVCAALLIIIVTQHLRNDKLARLAKENIERVKQLETELKEFTEKYRISEEARQKYENKKPPRSIDYSKLHMR